MKLIVQNLAVEYRDSGGSGQVLLFLHGWRDNLRTFDAVVSFLADKYRIIRLDLPGFGQSEMPPSAWALDDYISFTDAFIHKLNFRPAALIGHSFGGRIIIKGNAAGKLPAEKIILIAPAGVSFYKKTFRNLFWRILAKLGKGIVSEKFRRDFYKWIGSDYGEAGALRETFVKIVEEDLGSAAEKITVPTLLIWGADDEDTPLADGRRLNKLIPRSTLKIIAGVDHMVHQEKPREVGGLIEEFLR